MLMLWNVYDTRLVGDHTFEYYECSVDSDSADHACDIACPVVMRSRGALVAYPDESDSRKESWPSWAPRLLSLDSRKPGRPIERTGDYARITLEIRRDLLARIDASGKSRRQFIEELFEK